MTQSDKLYNIIDEAIIVASQMYQGTIFVELSTYFKNHIPGITNEEIEILRDILLPIQERVQKQFKNA